LHLRKVYEAKETLASCCILCYTRAHFDCGPASQPATLRNMQFNAIQTRLPTPAALALGERCRAPELFQVKKGDDKWKIAFRDFQKLLLSGTELKLAKEIILSYLPYDPQNGDDQNDEAISALDPILEKIAKITKAEALGIVMDEVVGMAIADPQSKWWIDGKTKLASVELLKGLIDGENSSGERRGLVLRLVNGTAETQEIEESVE
jgi:hypothetical protein